jgi:hypothetical protein
MNFLFSKASRLTLKATKPPILWVLGDSFFGIKQQSTKLMARLLLVLKLGMNGTTVYPLPTS